MLTTIDPSVLATAAGIGSSGAIGNVRRRPPGEPSVIWFSPIGTAERIARSTGPRSAMTQPQGPASRREERQQLPPSLDSRGRVMRLQPNRVGGELLQKQGRVGDVGHIPWLYDRTGSPSVAGGLARRSVSRSNDVARVPPGKPGGYTMAFAYCFARSGSIHPAPSRSRP